MSGATFDAEQLGQVLNGMLDVMFGFAIALERKGLLPRCEIVEVLGQVIRQATEQEGAPTKRTAIVELMLQALHRPIAGADARSRLQVLDGGKLHRPSDGAMVTSALKTP